MSKPAFWRVWMYGNGAPRKPIIVLAPDSDAACLAARKLRPLAHILQVHQGRK